MKLFALFFFIQTFPLVLFITTILYGGFSTTVLKEELAESGMYEKIISMTSDSSEEGADPLFAIIQKRIDPDYLQTKVEDVIDDTALWVTGKTQTPPVLSFKDIKDEITATNPTLLTEIQNMSLEMQKAAAAENGEMTTANQPNDLENFIKNDFSIPLKDSFIGIKQAYLGLIIALPVVIVLLILSLVGLWLKNPTLQKRLKWFGITFALTGVLGFVTILLNQGASTTSLSYLVGQENQIVQMIYPIIERVLLVFVNQYAAYQTIASSILLGLGIISFVLSFVIKSPAAAPAAKPVKPTKPATTKKR